MVEERDPTQRSRAGKDTSYDSGEVQSPTGEAAR